MFVQVQAFGKVEHDPQLVMTPGGIPFTEFPLAVNTKRCVEDITIKRSVIKGSMLFVQGHFTSHEYTTEAGKQEVSLEVNIEKFSFADESKSERNDQQ